MIWDNMYEIEQMCHPYTFAAIVFEEGDIYTCAYNLNMAEDVQYFWEGRSLCEWEHIGNNLPGFKIKISISAETIIND